MKLAEHLASLPSELSEALERTFSAAIDHFLRQEWDDAQVDGGRFAEAVLRYLQWRQKGSFTPIDGRSKPNRKSTINKVAQDSELPDSLRMQVAQSVELVMDFRNNRNSAHLGDLDANRLDAITVIQLVQWIMGEIVRLETKASPAEVQALIDDLAQPYVPLVQYVEDVPTVLDPEMEAADKALVLLYETGGKLYGRETSRVGRVRQLLTMAKGRTRRTREGKVDSSPWRQRSSSSSRACPRSNASGRAQRAVVGLGRVKVAQSITKRIESKLPPNCVRVARQHRLDSMACNLR